MSAAMLVSCVNQAQMHPADVLQKVSPASSVVLFSTYSKEIAVGFALGLVLYHVDANGQRGPVPGEKYGALFLLSHPYWQEKTSIPSDNVDLYWRALPAGDYVLTVVAINPHECLHSGPEYEFSAAPGEVLYLGEFHKDGPRVELQGSYGRDTGFFHDHVQGGGGAEIASATVVIKNVDYTQAPRSYQGSPVASDCISLMTRDLSDPHGTAEGASFITPK